MRLWLCIAALGCAGTQSGTNTPADAATSSDTSVSDTSTTTGACPMFPGDNAWNKDVSSDALDPQSATYIAAMAPTKTLHPDWGAPPYGIPWVRVPESQPMVPIKFEYADESDPGPYPIPPDAPIEGGADATGDRHVLVVQEGTCKLYELFAAVKEGAGWSAGSGAVFDLRSNKLRPEGWTSADAAGLPILPGLVRYDEVKAGKIAHAIRFTMVNSQKAYIHPATHYASSKTDPALPPMGLRVRLKASFDDSGFSAAGKVISAAMKKYGMLMADNGSDWFFTGDSNAGWDPLMDGLLTDFRKVHGADFEVVQSGALVK